MPKTCSNTGSGGSGGEKRQLEKKRLGRVGLSIGNGASLNLLIHISAPTLPSRSSSKAKLEGNKDFGSSEAKVNVSGAVLGIEQKIRRVIKP